MRRRNVVLGVVGVALSLVVSGVWYLRFVWIYDVCSTPYYFEGWKRRPATSEFDIWREIYSGLSGDGALVICPEPPPPPLAAPPEYKPLTREELDALRAAEAEAHMGVWLGWKYSDHPRPPNRVHYPIAFRLFEYKLYAEDGVTCGPDLSPATARGSVGNETLTAGFKWDETLRGVKDEACGLDPDGPGPLRWRRGGFWLFPW
ncbi:MAG: hypothetical protein LBU23_04265 [Planctomycetota bacterium]|jgi:hypothetical protein|nr:hypothetical protein [Planctomycetota bacterium]